MKSELLNSKKTKFGLFDAGLATLLFVIFNFVFMDAFTMIAINNGVTEFGILVAQFLVEALFGVAAVVVAQLCKVNIVKAAGMNKKISVVMLIYALLIAFCSIFFFASLTSSFLEFLSLLGYKLSSSSFDVDTFGKYIGYVIAACVTPAVCEELLFRGVIQSGLKKYGKWISIISASFIFMIMHGGPEQTIHQFIVGVIVGLIFFETGNLWLGVFVHFFNNFISITEVFVYNLIFKPSPESLEGTTEVVQEITASQAWTNFAINLWIAIIMACVGFVIVKFLIKQIIKEDRKINGLSDAIENDTQQTILVDGNEVEATVSISQNEIESEDDDITLEQLKNNQKTDEKMDLKTKIVFAIPMIMLLFEWVYALIRGFGG